MKSFENEFNKLIGSALRTNVALEELKRKLHEDFEGVVVFDEFASLHTQLTKHVDTATDEIKHAIELIVEHMP